MVSSVDPIFQSRCPRCEIAFPTENDHIPVNDLVCNECTGTNRKYKEAPKHDKPSSKLFPNPEKFGRRKLTPITSSQSNSQISKKPLRCLFSGCGKFVGVYDMSAHFRYEHKDVPHILTYFDVRNALEFSPKTLKLGEVQTMLLLDLNMTSTNDVKNSSRGGELSNGDPKKNQTLLVLATRLKDNDVEEKIHNKYKDRMREELKYSDEWIFWLSSNIWTNLSYTIAVSALGNETRSKYFGPIVHMEEDPLRLLDSGRCLLLNKFQIERMSGNFQKNLNLDVIIYAEESDI